MRNLLFAMAVAGAFWPAAGRAAALIIFGGDGHTTFLGCLTCNRFDAKSVLNQYGQYGNPYGYESIFNKYSPYGSRYSMYSPCNPYASDPPVIVDGEGNYYGRLTINEYRDQTKIAAIRTWIAGVCAGD